MKPEEEEAYWCNRANEIIMARHEPHEFFNHWVWKHPMDFVRIGSVFVAILWAIFEIDVQILLIIGGLL